MKSPLLFRIIRTQNGVVAVLTAILLVVFVGILALAVDLGYLYAARNELQNAADSGALAAARQLGAIYQGMSYADQQSYDCSVQDHWADGCSTDAETLRSVTRDVVLKNKAARINIAVNDGDIVIGRWDGSTLTPTYSRPDAVRVVARRDDAANSAVRTFFAGLLGVDSVPISASATAALTGQGSAPPGGVELPVGISKYWFTNNSCNDRITFYPTNDPQSCAGWNTFDLSPSNDITVRRILGNLPLSPTDPGYDSSLESPETVSGDVNYVFTGGTLSNPTFDAMLTAFQKKGYDLDANGDPVLDDGGEPMADGTGSGREIPLYGEDGITRLEYPDGTYRNRHAWETSVPVYDSDDCSNPTGPLRIVGFARVKIDDVQDAPDKTIVGQVICNYVEPEDSRGGGGSFGTLGSIPGLVE